MISLFDPMPQFKAPCPKYGQECASVLFQHRLIAETDQEKVAEVVALCAGEAEPAAAALSQRCLISRQNQAAVAEFIKRAVRRFLLKANDLSGDELSRVLGVDHVLARRIIKGTRHLTADHIKVLVARFMEHAGISARRVMG